jgi:hypothetical protein
MVNVEKVRKRARTNASVCYRGRNTLITDFVVSRNTCFVFSSSVFFLIISDLGTY